MIATVPPSVHGALDALLSNLPLHLREVGDHAGIAAARSRGDIDVAVLDERDPDLPSLTALEQVCEVAERSAKTTQAVRVDGVDRSVIDRGEQLLIARTARGSARSRPIREHLIDRVAARARKLLYR